jgi:NADH dehydrogenase
MAERFGTIGPDKVRELAAAKAQALRPAGPTRIVVLGGGFAGVYTAKYLTEALGRRKDVEVELLSERNYFVFQPLLPEVAAGGIAATHVVNPIREMVPGARFRCCQIKSIDFESKEVVVSQGDAVEYVGVPYDHLVFAFGKVTSFASMPGAAEHAFAMKDLSDAYRLRNHVLACLEKADIEHDLARKKEYLTFVVAGGGFSGVETIGEICELVTRSLKYFPHVSRQEVAFKLIHSQSGILPEMPKELGAAAARILEKRGIELVLEARVRAASPTRVYLKGDREIATRTFVCTVGNAPNPLARYAMKAGGFKEAEHGGKPNGTFATDRELRCLEKEGYWSVGDCAGIPSPDGQGLCPPTAQFAIREAKCCALNIVRTIDKKPVQPFAFKVLGLLASLGQRSAVAQVFGIRFSGFLAWFAWRTIYLSKLPGMIRRLRVTLDWTLDLFFPRDITQLDVSHRDKLRVHHYEPGEFIVRQGEIGRELFLIVAGEVEVVKLETGFPEKVLSRLGPKEVFGEKALLEDTKRTATVRAATAVEVLTVGRADFRTLVDQFPVLEEHFSTLLKERYPAIVHGSVRDAIAAEINPLQGEGVTLQPRTSALSRTRPIGSDVLGTS